MQLSNALWLGFWSIFPHKRFSHTLTWELLVNRMLLLLKLFPLTLVELFEPGSPLVRREFSHMQATVTTTQRKFIHYPNQWTRAGFVPVSAADIHLFRGGRVRRVVASKWSFSTGPLIRGSGTLIKVSPQRRGQVAEIDTTVRVAMIKDNKGKSCPIIGSKQSYISTLGR